MQLTAQEISMIRYALIKKFVKQGEEWTMVDRFIDPSEELDALSVHKKIGTCIEGKGTEQARFVDGEIDFSEDDKKLVSSFLKDMRVNVQELEIKNSLAAKMK